jgi:hypothetical protein
MNFSKPELSIRRKIEGPPSDPTGTKTASNGQISADYPISALPPPKVLQQQIPPPDLSYHILLVEVSLLNHPHLILLVNLARTISSTKRFFKSNLPNTDTGFK